MVTALCGGVIGRLPMTAISMAMTRKKLQESEGHDEQNGQRTHVTVKPLAPTVQMSRLNVR